MKPIKGFYLCFVILSFFIFSFFLSQDSYASELDSIISYEDQGFAFSYPYGWMLVNSPGTGSNAGNLTLGDSCTKFSLSWIRDLGIDPSEVINQIKGSYDSVDVQIISSKEGDFDMQDGLAKTLKVEYVFKGTASKETIAVWNSSRSDRLFLASFSSCDNENNGTLFQNILKSFIDQEHRETARTGPKTSKGYWQIILGDFLSSFHYTDMKKLPARVIHISVEFQLSPHGESNSVNSQVTIWANPPEDAVRRVQALASILNKAGYETHFTQEKGKIGIAVRDYNGTWQQISINPESAEKMVGVLTNGSNEVQIYHDYFDLARENGIYESRIPDSVIQKDCEPSSYIELKKLGNLNNSWLDELRNVLDNYSYGRKYEENVFDCSDTSQICWSILEKKGYDARIIMSYKGHPLDPHMWVVVKSPDKEGEFVAVETATTDQNGDLVDLGRITFDDAYFKGIMYNSSLQFSRVHPKEGLGKILMNI